MRPSRLPIIATLFLAATPLTTQQHAGTLAALEGTESGLAGMSGRASDAEVVLADRSMVYVGSAAAGVFQPNPDVVWVGRREGNPRNRAGVGRGLRKSVDGGRSWASRGFEPSERFHRVVTHPTFGDGR